MNEWTFIKESKKAGYAAIKYYKETQGATEETQTWPRQNMYTRLTVEYRGQRMLNKVEAAEQNGNWEQVKQTEHKENRESR